MNKLLATIKLHNVPQPLKLSTIIYITSSIFYTGYMSYNDGVKELRLYNESKVSSPYLNELDAIKNGCSKNSFDHFIKGITFPYSIISEVIPYVILKINQN